MVVVWGTGKAAIARDSDPPFLMSHPVRVWAQGLLLSVVYGSFGGLATPQSTKCPKDSLGHSTVPAN